ncbi:hypothetical protein NHH03_20915 [Stieleria sp. TO1_6]|uniref:hypothetical protein n=1 Tax=Stieleria tagensis TaxID=2956795 RepID=UPI00209BADCE|nr:hypothetical protein [Stieleria tagensis]MCO8124217.1 hypothetical protein [Stieleria tagensis]
MRVQRTSIMLCGLVWGCTLITTRLPAQDAQEAPAAIADQVHAFTDKEVDQYRFFDRSGKEIFTRVPRSLLRWSKATERTAFGDTYLWIEKGCARAVVSIYAITSPQKMISAECQSLSDAPFTMRRGDAVVWSPQSEGVDFKPLPVAGVPATTPTARGAQMNRIARMFRAEYSPHTSPDEVNPLRLLSRPLYRYQSSDDQVIDGAVYGFVDATDPEMLLVIEARQSEGKTAWYYSPARSRHDPIRIYLNNEIVWDVPRLAPPWEQIRDPSRTYFNLQLEKIVDPEWFHLMTDE